MHRFPPGNNANDGGVHRQVERGHHDDGSDDRPRNRKGWALYLTREETDVVITAKIVHCDERCASDTPKKSFRGRESTGREIEGSMAVEIHETGNRNPSQGSENHGPHDH